MDDEIINEVWNKGRIINGMNPNLFRQDPCGAIIAYNQYGQKSAAFGWEIDHVYPLSKGGDDNILNLRPMHWRNNFAKGDDYPIYSREVTSDGTNNIESRKEYRVNLDTQRQLSELYNIHD